MKTQYDRDKLYLDIAQRYSEESSCLRRQVGCVITVENRIVVAGWNGAPKGIISCKEKNQCMRENSKSGENLQTCLACHSEMNAITQASRMGISIKNGTLYCTHKPCSLCSKLIINSGIIRVVYREDYPEKLGEELLKQANILVEKFND